MKNRLSPPTGGELLRRFSTFTPAKTRASGTRIVDSQNRTARISFSSEAPVSMGFGREILDHSKGSIRLGGVRQRNMPLLYNHNMDDLIGVVESIDVENNRGYATVRFASDERGQWAMDQVEDGILRNTSFMYRVYAYREEDSDDEDDDEPTYRATDWEPFEISLVTIPADPSVGVARSISHFTGRNRIMETQDLSRSERRRAAADNAAVAAATENERTRAAEISAMCRRHAIADDIAHRMVADGTSLEDCRSFILDQQARRGNQLPMSPAGAGGSADPVHIERQDLSAHALGITEKELNQFSILRAVQGMALDDLRAKRAWGLEREISTAYAQATKSTREGLHIPPELRISPLAKRTPLYAGSTGAAVVATNLLSDAYVEPLYQQTTVVEAGATLLTGLVGNIAVPRMSASDQVTWVASEGATYGNTAPSLNQITMTPHDVSAYVDVTRRLVMQSTPSIEGLLRSDLARITAIAIDQAAYVGTGASGQPTGILNTSGVSTIGIGANGGSLTLGILGQMYGALASANALNGAMSWIATGGLVAKMKTTQKFSVGSDVLWEDPMSERPAPGEGNVLGLRGLLSNALPSAGTKGTGTNLNAILLANFNDLLIAEWGTLTVLVDPYSLSSSGGIRITVAQTIDIAVRHAASFVVCTDATLT